MDPIKRPLQATNSGDPANKRSRRSDHQPLDLKGSSMADSVEKPRLKLIVAPDRFLNMPAVTLFLQRMFIDTERQQSLELSLAKHSQLAPLSYEELRAGSAVTGAHRECSELLRTTLVERDLSEELKSTINQNLALDSAFGVYGDFMESNFNGSESIVKSILNVTREIARELIQAPENLLTEALDNFPPSNNELLCLDGTLSRLESTLSGVHRQQVQLGLRRPAHLLQILNKAMASQYSFFNALLEETSRSFLFDKYVHPGMEVHVRAGLYEKLGVKSSIIIEKDRFAHASVQDVPGQVFFNQMLSFERSAVNSIRQATQEPQVLAALNEFEQQLKSVLYSGQKEDYTVFAAQLLEINKSALAKALLEKVVEEPRFEQRFGVWNEDVTQLQDWDWGGINQALASMLDGDWSLAGSIQDHPLAQAFLASNDGFSLLGGISQKVLRNAVILNKSNQDRYHSLQVLRAKIETVSNDPNSANIARVISFTQLCNLLEHDPVLYLLPIAEASHQLSSFFNKNFGVDDVNAQLFEQICHLVDERIKPAYPYENNSIAKIVNALAQQFNGVAQPLCDLVLLFNTDYTVAKIEADVAKSLAAFPQQSTDENISALRDFLVHEKVQISPDAFSFYQALVARDPQLNKSVLMALAKTLFSPEITADNVAFFIQSYDQRLSEIWSFDEIHESFPQLAQYVARKSLELGMEKSALNIFQSKKARDILLNNSDNSIDSFPMFAEHYLGNNSLRVLREVIDQQAWPKENYLDLNGQLRESNFVKFVIANGLIERFEKMLEALVDKNILYSDDLFEGHLIPYFQKISSYDEGRFFIQMCDFFHNISDNPNDALSSYMSKICTLISNEPEERHHALIAILVESLPETVVEDLAQILALQGNLSISVIRNALRARGVDITKLETLYPPTSHKNERHAQLLCGATVRQLDSYSVASMELTIFEREVLKDLLAHPLDVFKGFGSPELIRQCQRQGCTQEQVIDGLLQRLSIREISSFLASFIQTVEQNQDLVLSIGQEAAGALHAYCQVNKKGLTQRVIHALEQKWQFVNENGRWSTHALDAA